MAFWSGVQRAIALVGPKGPRSVVSAHSRQKVALGQLLEIPHGLLLPVAVPFKFPRHQLRHLWGGFNADPRPVDIEMLWDQGTDEDQGLQWLVNELAESITAQAKVAAELLSVMYRRTFTFPKAGPLEIVLRFQLL